MCDTPAFRNAPNVRQNQAELCSKPCTDIRWPRYSGRIPFSLKPSQSLLHRQQIMCSRCSLFNQEPQPSEHHTLTGAGLSTGASQQQPHRVEEEEAQAAVAERRLRQHGQPRGLVISAVPWGKRCLRDPPGREQCRPNEPARTQSGGKHSA